jgi:MSHA pilin protein MshD
MRLSPFRPFSTAQRCSGFTLIEMIIGIVVLAIAMLLITSFLAPQGKRGVAPVIQMRAAELGNSLMQEIISKSFDENSDHNGGGLWRCGDSGEEDCTSADSYGPDDSESRTTYDDVDDYDTSGSFVSISNALGDSTKYTGFTYAVSVVATDVDADGNSNDSQLTGYTEVKRIDLTVRTSSGDDFEFAMYRWNY